LACARNYPFVTRDLAFSLNLQENPEGRGVKGKRACQQTRGKVRPVIVTREVRRFMQQNMMKVGWLQIRR
jgi:hypothetical protein